MVLVDASTRCSYVYLLSTRNVAFAKLLPQIIKLRDHHLDYLIKSIRLDNVDEFTSKTFDGMPYGDVAPFGDDFAPYEDVAPFGDDFAPYGDVYPRRHICSRYI